jgi:hypothetical protein
MFEAVPRDLDVTDKAAGSIFGADPAELISLYDELPQTLSLQPYQPDQT